MESKILKISKKDIDKDNFYKDDEIKFEGNIEIDENLNYIKFKKSIVASGFILAKADSGIEAGEGIEAGLGIEAGDGIISFFNGKIIGKFISAIHIAAGFNIQEEQEIIGKIRKGKVILGKIIEKKEV